MAGVCARSAPAAARRNTKLRLLMALIAGNRIRFARSPGQLDRLAVGSVTIGVSPGFFALQQRGGIGQTLAVYQVLQSRQPVVVIVRAIVGLTSLGRSSEFG